VVMVVSVVPGGRDRAMPAVPVARVATAVLVGLRILIRVLAASAVMPGRAARAVTPPVTDTRAVMAAMVVPVAPVVTVSMAVMADTRARAVPAAMAQRHP